MKKILSLMILFISTLYCTAQYTVGYYKYGVLTECSFDKATFLHNGDILYSCRVTADGLVEDSDTENYRWIIDDDVPNMITWNSYTPTSADTIIAWQRGPGDLLYIRPVLYSFELQPPACLEENESYPINTSTLAIDTILPQLFGLFPQQIIFSGYLVNGEETSFASGEQTHLIEYLIIDQTELTIDPVYCQIDSLYLTLNYRDYSDLGMQCSPFTLGDQTFYYSEEIFEYTIDDNNCIRTHFILDPCNYIEPIETESFSLYPNPVIDILHFSEDCNFRILDSTGRTVLAGQSNSINVSSLPSGMYFYINEKNAIRFSKQ